PPPPGLARIDALAGELDGYHLLHAARADFLRRDGSLEEAAKSYARALDLATNERERRYFERRLREVGESDRLTAAAYCGFSLTVTRTSLSRQGVNQ
ncbi:MAG: hypothetical protein WEF99_07600, partial [Thermoanaerobaculia bacterium]